MGPTVSPTSITDTPTKNLTLNPTENQTKPTQNPTNLTENPTNPTISLMLFVFIVCIICTCILYFRKRNMYTKVKNLNQSNTSLQKNEYSFSDHSDMSDEKDIEESEVSRKSERFIADILKINPFNDYNLNDLDSDDELKEDVPNDLAMYNFGIQWQYWKKYELSKYYVVPRHDNLKQELL
eukprot:417416_1